SPLQGRGVSTRRPRVQKLQNRQEWNFCPFRAFFEFIAQLIDRPLEQVHVEERNEDGWISRHELLTGRDSRIFAQKRGADPAAPESSPLPLGGAVARARGGAAIKPVRERPPSGIVERT